MFTSELVTQQIRVRVNCRYSPERSDPRNSEWFFLYTVTISNEGQETAQLINRHWIITDASGRVEEVRGPGVVGEQPILRPGEKFEYTSGCPLKTPFGAMEGEYEMIGADGKAFLALIAPFALQQPGSLH